MDEPAAGQRRSAGDIYHEAAWSALRESDEQVHALIEREYERLGDTLQLIAAENQCSQAVLAALGSVIQNKTTEGFVGARYHGGCEVVDGVEWLACERAKAAFGAQYANVQPHSGTSANQIVMTAVLDRGDRVLSLSMDQGG
ncbi:MAG TPA: serine hydroxymethyltransferase, partial [Phycisphaerales bacterium]|nr:serine hydroxymethyltransferase [Phycisphaerales bacterium]